tara:strand:+ start:875 stop:1984 length:1110 start_codon:yes stop_codon:yes gene_type:complete
MIKLKHLLTEIDDEKIIKYKDKDGKPGEMKAGSAKTMQTDHPAKIAWDKMSEKDSEGGDDKKDDSQKVSFDRTAGDGAKKAEPKAGGDPSQKRSKSNPSGWYNSDVPGKVGRVSKGIVKDGKVTISVNAKKKHGHGKDIVADIDKIYDAISDGRPKAISREDFVKQIEDGTVEFTTNDLNSKEFPGTGVMIKFKSAEEWNSKADGTAGAEMDPKMAAKYDVYPDNPRAEPKDPKPKGQKVVDGKFTVGDGDKKEEVDVEAFANTLDLPGIDAKTLAKKFESGDAKMEADENGRISFSFKDPKLGYVRAEVEEDGTFDSDVSDLGDGDGGDADEDDKERLQDALRDTLDYYHDQFKKQNEGMIKLKDLLR